MQDNRRTCNYQAFANIFELASCALTYPTASFAEAVASKEFSNAWSKAAAQALENTEEENRANDAVRRGSGESSEKRVTGQSGVNDIVFRPGAPGGNVLSKPARETPGEMLHRLRCAYTNTFLNMPHALVSPYESAWTSQGKALLFANDTCESVKAAYRKQGLEPQMLQEPADHIAYELGFFAIMLRDEQSRDAAQRFWNDHLGQWVDRLCKAVVDTSAPFYAQLCRDLFLACKAVNDNMHSKKAPHAA